jgi:hypothetical protein
MLEWHHFRLGLFSGIAFGVGVGAVLDHLKAPTGAFVIMALVSLVAIFIDIWLMKRRDRARSFRPPHTDCIAEETKTAEASNAEHRKNLAQAAVQRQPFRR